MECLPAVDGERAALLALDQVVAQARLSDGVFSPALVEVLEHIIHLAYPRVTIRVLEVVARTQKAPLVERLVQSFHQIGFGEGAKPAEFFQLLEPLGQLAPVLVTRIVIQTWLENPSRAGRYHGLVLLSQLLEIDPGPVAVELVEAGTRALSTSLFGEGQVDPNWLVVAYNHLPSHPGGELLGLVEDLLSRWSQLGDPRLLPLLSTLKPARGEGQESVLIRWMLLGILPALPQGQSRPWWKVVAVGFTFPPPGMERRWLATGREWTVGKGPHTEEAPLIQQRLLNHILSVRHTDIQVTQLRNLWLCVVEGGDVPRALVCAAVRLILKSDACPVDLLPSIETWLLAHPLDESRVEVALWLGHRQPRTTRIWETLTHFVVSGGAKLVLVVLSRVPGVANTLPASLVNLLLDVEITPPDLPGLLVLVAAGMVRNPDRVTEILGRVVEQGISPTAPGPAILAEAMVGLLSRPPRSGLEVCTQLLSSPQVSAAARSEVLLRLAVRLTEKHRESRNVTRLFTSLLSSPLRYLRIQVANAIKNRVAAPELSEELFLALVEEAKRPIPSVDVLATALHFLERDVPLSSRRVAWAVQQVMCADSPVIVEPDLVLVALTILRRLENHVLDEPTLGENIAHIRGQLEVRLPTQEIPVSIPS